jgi:hypothetical protein
MSAGTKEIFRPALGSLEDLHERTIEEPVDPDCHGHSVGTGAVAGAWLGWLLGLCFGVGFVRLPQAGLVLARGSFLTALLVDVAATLIGCLMGALIAWIIRQEDRRL